MGLRSYWCMMSQMSRVSLIPLTGLLLAALMGCNKPQTVVLSDEEQRGFKEGNQSGNPRAIEGARADRSGKDVDEGSVAPEGREGMRTPPPPEPRMSTPRTPDGIAPNVEANHPSPGPDGDARPNPPANGEAGRRSGFGRYDPDRSESTDFTINGAKISVIGVFKIDENKVIAWKADGSPNAPLKARIESKLATLPAPVRALLGSGGPRPMLLILSQVTGGRKGMVQSGLRGMRGLGDLFAENEILTFGRLEDGAPTASAFYVVEDQAPMTATFPFKEGASAKMGTGTINLQSIGDGAAPDEEGSGTRHPGGNRKPTGHLVLLTSGLPSAPISVQLVGKDNKPFTMVDKDGKAFDFRSMNGGQPGGPERMPDVGPAVFIAENDKNSIVLNLFAKRDLIQSMKVTIAPQTIIERKGIAAKPK